MTTWRYYANVGEVPQDQKGKERRNDDQFSTSLTCHVVSVICHGTVAVEPLLRLKNEEKSTITE
eukprot:534837-Amphidinium_carterae.1